MLPTLIIIVTIIFVIGLFLYFFFIYNRLQRLKNSSTATLGQVQVAMKKRLDLIEELLDAVKSYTRFERDTFEKITSLRAEVLRASAGGLSDIDEASRRFLGGIMAVVENYPELRTSEPVGSLMDSSREVEGEIARHRYAYNNIIQEYNIMLDTVPSRYVASSLSMTKIEYLDFEEEVEEHPETGFKI